MNKETAFKEAMQGRLYGAEETADAQAWFNEGYETLRAENAKLIAERDELKEQISNVRNEFEGISWPHTQCIKLLKGANIDFSGSHGESIVYAVEKLIAERDLYKNNCVAYDCNCASCKTVFLGEKEQHICFKCILAEREQWMKQEPVVLAHIRMQDDGPEIDIEVLDGTDLQPEMTPIKLYTHPLPAQQVPEGNSK